jgi:uncharacterized RDD family membrane protein YckC
MNTDQPQPPPGDEPDPPADDGRESPGEPRPPDRPQGRDAGAPGPEPGGGPEHGPAGGASPQEGSEGPSSVPPPSGGGTGEPAAGPGSGAQPPGGPGSGAPPPSGPAEPPPPTGPGFPSAPPPSGEVPGSAGGPGPYGEADPLAGMPPLPSRGRRLVARIIDALIIGIPMSLLLWAITGDRDYDTASSSNYLQQAAIIIVYFVYEGAMLSARGQTLGKMAMRIRVAMLENGAVPHGSPGWFRAGVYSLPELLPCFGFIFWLVNVLNCTWDKPYRQCLHDKAARTVVVSTA